MTYQTEFPDFDGAQFADELLASGDWEDISWGAEDCPRFQCDVFEVFIDYADQTKREWPEMARFIMQDEGNAVLETDDWADILAFINDGKRDFPDYEYRPSAWFVGRYVEICSYRMGSNVEVVDGDYAILKGANGSFFLAHGNPDEFCFPCEGDDEQCPTLEEAKAQLAAEKARITSELV